MRIIFILLLVPFISLSQSFKKVDKYYKKGEIALADREITTLKNSSKWKEDAEYYYLVGCIKQKLFEQDEDTNNLKAAIKAYSTVETAFSQESMKVSTSQMSKLTMWNKQINAGTQDYENGEYNLALLHFRKAQIIRPLDTLAYLYAGTSAYQSLQYDIAFTNYQRLYEVNPSVKHARRLLDFHTTMIQDKTYSIELAKELKKNHPKEVYFSQQLADLFLFDLQLDEAENIVTQSLEAHPNDLSMMLRLGLVYKMKAKNNPLNETYFMRSRKSYNQVLELDSNNFSAHYNLAMLLLQQAQQKEMILDEMDQESFKANQKFYSNESEALKSTAITHLWRANTIDPKDLITLKALKSYYTHNGNQTALMSINQQINGLSGLNTNSK